MVYLLFYLLDRVSCELLSFLAMLIFSRRSSAAGRQPDKLLCIGLFRLRPYTLRNRSVRCVPFAAGNAPDKIGGIALPLKANV